ncbi:MAG: diacylglycerol kinase family protein [Candidatus Saccharimonadales bacterium]
MKVFDHIAIVYNPKSTGDAPKMAKDLRDSINGHFEIIQKKAVLYPTKRAEHAIEIANDIAQKYARPLIVSVSGDGGYNEIINGVMAAKKLFPAQQPTVAIMAAGNANDHKRVMRADTPLIRLIKEADIKIFDLISLDAKSKDFELTRYAHSYIGLGITPEVGHALNNNGKSRWNEVWLTFKTLKNFTPFTVLRDGITRQYDSLVFANINEMAKFVKLDSKNTVRDGKFEVVAVRHRGKLHTIISLAAAVIHGFKNAPSHKTYTFKLPSKQLVQLDGEIVELPQESVVVIKSHHEAIHSLF